MVVIGGYVNFYIRELNEQTTIQACVDMYDGGDAFYHVCKPSLEQWRKATGITKGQEKSFVADEVFPRKAQCELQGLEEDAAKERERVEQEKKGTDALRCPCVKTLCYRTLFHPYLRNYATGSPQLQA
jgi:hypothetical protein